MAERPVLPLQTRIKVFTLKIINNACFRRDGTVNRRLLSIIISSLRLTAPPSPKPLGGVSTHDITVDSSRNLWFRVFVPTDVAASGRSLPVIVFFHGGGFIHLSPNFKAYDQVCRRLAREIPTVVVSVNYRFAPEHPFPAQYDDGFDVLKFLDQKVGPNVLPTKADLSRCFLAGDSAGANLAHHVAKRACESKFTHLKVIGLVAIQPFFGGEERIKSQLDLAGIEQIVTMEITDWMWKAFLPPGPEMNRDHEAINVSGPKAADLSKLDFPTTMVVVAGFDSLKDWQKRYYEWLKRSGKETYLVEYPKMIHDFYLFPELPESTELVSELQQFIQKQCSKVAN